MMLDSTRISYDLHRCLQAYPLSLIEHQSDFLVKFCKVKWSNGNKKGKNRTAFLTAPLHFYAEILLLRLKPSLAIRSKVFEAPQSATHPYPAFLPARPLAELQRDL